MYNWNRVRSTLLSIRLDSCFGLVGPLQQPVIVSNVDPARNHLYQANAPAAGIQYSNVVMPYGCPQLRKALSFEALCRQHGFDRGPVAEEVQPDRNSCCSAVLTNVWIVLYSNYTRQTSDSLSIKTHSYGRSEALPHSNISISSPYSESKSFISAS